MPAVIASFSFFALAIRSAVRYAGQKGCEMTTSASGRARSKAEFGVAKHTYVSTNSGWFSDRTECYLASGRPALAQDTGWTAHLPAGEGLLSFSTPDEALAAIDRVNSDYRRHARRAGEIAREHFDASRVLSRLLEEACS